MSYRIIITFPDEPDPTWHEDLANDVHERGGEIASGPTGTGALPCPDAEQRVLPTFATSQPSDPAKLAEDPERTRRVVTPRFPAARNVTAIVHSRV